jgi:hypothetical protein
MQADLNEEMERDQRDKFLDEVNAAYSALRTVPRGLERGTGRTRCLGQRVWMASRRINAFKLSRRRSVYWTSECGEWLNHRQW